ncbi:hypothetical protein [Lactiplantibacillus plantarum]|uniref:hypothetical protein n=1 Tax=Lactiplantibacillus plantarum TaxID=1590 RepID=UPI0020735247|nr:hypothetical protein [Lactiplantibacillus plantarum]
MGFDYYEVLLKKVKTLLTDQSLYHEIRSVKIDYEIKTKIALNKKKIKIRLIIGTVFLTFSIICALLLGLFSVNDQAQTYFLLSLLGVLTGSVVSTALAYSLRNINEFQTQVLYVQAISLMNEHHEALERDYAEAKIITKLNEEAWMLDKRNNAN